MMMKKDEWRFFIAERGQIPDVLTELDLGHA
jgi:hypothetical protein